MTTLAGKTAVVTGAAGALGLAVVRTLLEDGAQVALVDVDAMRLDGMIRFLRGATVAVPCDAGDPEAVKRAYPQIEKTLGPVDILVHHALVTSSERTEVTSDANWRRVMAVNVDAAFFWARTVLPGMRQRRWGRIIYVWPLVPKSAGATAGTAYAASRGALTGLTEALAREFAAEGVTVNAVAPAYVKTPLITEELNEQQQRLLLAQIPVGRFCEPEEFAHAVRFLAAPLAGFVTGEVISVDGGLPAD